MLHWATAVPTQPLPRQHADRSATAPAAARTPWEGGIRLPRGAGRADGQGCWTARELLLVSTCSNAAQRSATCRKLNVGRALL
jgi:hypothetical protein